jgi:hypothetical protein
MAVRFVPPFQIFNRRGAWRSDTFSKQANGSNGSKNSVLHPMIRSSFHAILEMAEPAPKRRAKIAVPKHHTT